MKKERNKGRDDHMIMSHGRHMMASHVYDHVTNSLHLCMMFPRMYCGPFAIIYDIADFVNEVC